MTCSVGIATLDHRSDTQATLLANAELALLEAKRSGGNCVYPPPHLGSPEAGDDDEIGAPDLSLVAAVLQPRTPSHER
jgi:hypothetical protein